MSFSVALALTALLLLLNAFFVMAEFAIVKVRRSRVEELTRQGHRRAVVLQRITDNLEATLPAIQLDVTMASLGIGWIGEPAVARLLRHVASGWPNTLRQIMTHSVSFGAAFIVITFVHVVAGELVPKFVAIRYPTASALWTSV